MKKYLSNTYEEARKKFLDKTIHWKKESFKVDDGLFIDVAIHNPQAKKNDV